MDPSNIRKIVKESQNLDIEEEVFEKFSLLLDSVSRGLNKSELKIPAETEPCFFRVSR